MNEQMKTHTRVHTYTAARGTKGLAKDKIRGTARPFCTKYKVTLVTEEQCMYVEEVRGVWSHGGWSSQDKNGNKARGSRGTGLELPYPWGG